MPDWKRADDPPKGAKGKWTEEVIVVTTRGIYGGCAYFNGDDGGCWQRPEDFEEGERVTHWIYPPWHEY